MSNRPTKDRSFASIERDDLAKLAELALERLEAMFCRHPDKRKLFEGKLIAICLCQGAADHFVHQGTNRDPGVNDFDLWAFYARVQGHVLSNRKASNADFGKSKFGRSEYDRDRYLGRRVDVFWRGIAVEDGASEIASVQRHIATSHTNSARHLRKKSGVIVWPRSKLGHVAWIGADG